MYLYYEWNFFPAQREWGSVKLLDRFSQDQGKVVDWYLSQLLLTKYLNVLSLCSHLNETIAQTIAIKTVYGFIKVCHDVEKEFSIDFHQIFS